MTARLPMATLLFVLWPATACADDLRPGYLELREICTSAPGRDTHIGTRNIGSTTGLLPDTECPSFAPPGTHRYAVTWKTPIKASLAARVFPTFPADCTADATPDRRTDVDALLATWVISCAKPLAGRTVSLAGIGNTPGDALLRYQPLSGETQAARLTPARPSATIAHQPVRNQVARTYFSIGIEHILMGYDHLLFVLCLVLLLGGIWRVAATITAFTIAHSLTLVATSLELFSMPRAPVEAAIALSIIFLAVEVIKRDPLAPRLSERLPWVMAFLFGLLHGFGFAGALAEIGLPTREVPTALLTFNLGVEAGQLLIVGASMAVLALIQKMKSAWLKPTQSACAYAIGSVAVMWLFQRVIGV